MNPTVYTSCIDWFWTTAKAENINEEAQIHAKVDGKKVIISEAIIRRDLKFKDEEELIAYQMNHSTINIQTSEEKKPRESKNKDTQETQPSAPTDEALNDENVPAQSNDPPLSRVNTLRSKEDRLKLNELMEICTKLQQRVIDLENTNTIQAQEISSLRKRVKRLNKKRRMHPKQGRNIADIDADAETTLVNETTEDQGRYNDQEMFDIIVLDDKEEALLKEAQDVQNIKKSKPKGDKVVSEQELEQDATITTTIVTIPTPDSTRPNVKGVVMQEPNETLTTTTMPISSKVQDKGKGIMVEEPLKMKKKDQISFDEQEARRLQVEINEKDRLAEEKAQLIEEENLA
uniref:Xylulose kinase-1 n=1 Tax=Tanacetum cinerariifolium TaxID=118510 RepID=A0A6L2L6I0_TANCI|nr:hypothetical protein [Tanacetum cinerariifolium]